MFVCFSSSFHTCFSLLFNWDISHLTISHVIFVCIMIAVGCIQTYSKVQPLHWKFAGQKWIWIHSQRSKSIYRKSADTVSVCDVLNPGLYILFWKLFFFKKIYLSQCLSEAMFEIFAEIRGKSYRVHHFVMQKCHSETHADPLVLCRQNQCCLPSTRV